MNEIQKLPPPQSGRVETGVIQFGDDWPGVFFRGDNAMYLGYLLSKVISNSDLDPFFERPALQGLADQLQKCRVE